MRQPKIVDGEAATITSTDCTITLSIYSKLEHVCLIRAALAGILRELEVPEHEIILLQLAVSEVVSNAIEHGYRGEICHTVDVSLLQHRSELEIDIADDSPAIPVDEIRNLLRQRAEGIEASADWPMRGHGLHIVQQAIDSLDFSRDGGRNHVMLRKRIAETAAQSG